MTEKTVLIEKSFADAVAMIAAAGELPEHTRRHWPTSLRKIAQALDKSLEVIPARYSAVRAELIHLHHVPAGFTAKTLANHKSNVKSALLYLAREKEIPQYGAPLSPAWQRLIGQVADSLLRSRLSAFVRFCSANVIMSAAVDEAVSIASWSIGRAAASPRTTHFGGCWRGPGMRMSARSPAGRRAGS